MGMMVKMDGDKVKYTLGQLKVWQTRLASYIGMINFFMILYLYIIESPMDFEWYHWVLLILFAVIIILVIDIKYVFPASQEYAFHKNPEWMKLRKDIRRNSEKLDRIIEMGEDNG